AALAGAADRLLALAVVEHAHAGRRREAGVRVGLAVAAAHRGEHLDTGLRHRHAGAHLIGGAAGLVLLVVAVKAVGAGEAGQPAARQRDRAVADLDLVGAAVAELDAGLVAPAVALGGRAVAVGGGAGADEVGLAERAALDLALPGGGVGGAGGGENKRSGEKGAVHGVSSLSLGTGPRVRHRRTVENLLV